MGSLLWLSVAVGAFALQQVAIRALPPSSGVDSLRQAIFVGTTLAVVAVALRYRAFLGAWLVAGGIVLNLLPVLAHSGNMPVAWETVHASGDFPEITVDMVGSQLPGSKDLLLHRGDIRFEPLSDRYAVHFPGYKPNIYSVGDFVIFAGVAVAAAEAAALVFGVLPVPARVFGRRHQAMSGL